MTDRIKRSPAEVDTDVVFVKSEIWEVPGSTEVVWTASHPSGWSAQGRSPNASAAQQEIEDRLAEAMELKIDRSVRVNRLHYDGPGLN